MAKQYNDKSWAVLATICVVILSLWIMSCAPVKVDVPKVVAPVVSSIPEPPDVLANGPIPFGSSFQCPFKAEVLVGRPAMATVVYAYESGEKLVIYMITLLDPMAPDGYITEAWVDANGDGTYDLYFEGQDALLDAYPNPCDAIGRPV